MKLQKIAILALSILICNSHAMQNQEKPCVSIDELSKDHTSYYSWLPSDLRKELSNIIMSDSPALKWTLHKHAESVGYGAKHLKGHTQNVNCLAVDKEKNILFAGAFDNTIKKWDLQTGYCQNTLQGHTDAISSLVVANNYLFSGSWDNTIKMWSIKKLRCKKTLLGHTSLVMCLAFKNNRLFSGSQDTTIKIWNLETGLCQMTLEGHTDCVISLAVVDNKIVSGSDKMIKIWDLETGHCLKTLQGHTEYIKCLAFAYKKIISGSYDETIKIWNPETGQCEKTLHGHTNVVRSLIVANNNIISGSYDNTIKIWDLADGHCCYLLKVPSCLIRHIDPAAGCVYGIDGKDIIILTLEDASIKKELHPNMDTVNLLESAYECSQNNKALDLRTDAWLHNAFTRLPIALQEVIQKEITVQLPS